MLNTKKVFIIVLVIALTFTTITAFAQSAKEAIMALKKLQARIQSGISYRDYSSALGEAKFPVNLFQESKEAPRNIKLTESIARTMKHYEQAGAYWNYKFSIWEYGIGKDDEQEIIAIYPDADKDSMNEGARISGCVYIERLLPVVWRAASKELAIASNLYSQTETENESSKPEVFSIEIENLKRENEKLKAENANLKRILGMIKSQRK